MAYLLCIVHEDFIVHEDRKGHETALRSAPLQPTLFVGAIGAPHDSPSEVFVVSAAAGGFSECRLEHAVRSPAVT
jgi:hypothetical protein